METSHAVRLADAAKALRSTVIVLLEHVDRLCDLIDKSPPNQRPLPAVEIDLGARPLRIDRAAYSVSFGDAHCKLGHTKGFLVLERLARRPDEYIHADQVIDEVWKDGCDYSTLRSTICRLKGSLRHSGLADLAERIDGQVRRHYRLVQRKG